jgi:hypothetical protein
MDDFDPERSRLLRKTLITISVLIPVGAAAAAFLSVWAATRLGYGATGQAISEGAGIALVAGLGFWSILSLHHRWESRMGKATAEQIRRVLPPDRLRWRLAVGGGLGAMFLGGWVSERLGYGAATGLAVGLALAVASMIGFFTTRKQRLDQDI